MYITFRNSKIKKLCELEKLAIQKLGPKQKDMLFKRIGEIRAVSCLAELKTLPGPRCHRLQGDRNGQYAVDLGHPMRLIFLPISELKVFEETRITEVEIIEVVDYH